MKGGNGICDYVENVNNENRLGKNLFTNGETGDLVNINCHKSGKDEATAISDVIDKHNKNYYKNLICEYGAELKSHY